MKGASLNGNGGHVAQFIYNNGIYAYYTIYLPHGGHTTQKLQIVNYAVGESVT